MNNITIAIIAFFSAAMGSLISPWINWKIEIKKIKLHNRKSTVEAVRNLVLNESTKFEIRIKELITYRESKKKTQFYPDAITYFDTLFKHSAFHKIIPYLKTDTILILKNSELLKFKDRGTGLGQLPAPYAKIMNNLSELEKNWKLM